MSISTGLDSPAGTAVANVLSDVRIHSFPAVVTGDQFERLCSSRVASGRGIMMLTDNSRSGIFVVGDVDLFSIVKKSIFLLALCELEERVSVLALF
jgi:hypothetical protein